jgi:hypothetical protein
VGDALPPDWRERFVAMVAGREPPRPEWFTGGPGLTPAQQAAIYPEQYRLRLHDGLRAELPGLTRWDPERRDWDALFAAYLLAHPATAFTLNRVADPFADWFEAHGAPRAEVEMARLDALVSRAFEAADAEPLPHPIPERVRLAPPVGLLRVSSSVHEVRHALLTGAPPPPLRAAAAGVVVYRRAREVRHWVPPAPVFSILAAIAGGASLADAVAAPLQEGRATLDELRRGLSAWMADVGERGLLTGA